MWQWIFLYAVVGIAVYFLVYHFLIEKKTNYTASPTPVETTVNNEVLLTKKDPVKGNYLTDIKGVTLYTYDKDTVNTSVCTGSCISNWPAYKSKGNTPQLREGVGVITRSDGGKQYTWRGMPLYYSKQDTEAGMIEGDGAGEVWHIIKI